MERLDGNLDDLIETVPNIPLALKRSILEDVSRGLLYLHKHTPQIIHRDLTAKNVLLTSSFVAKITDFGNSRIVNLQPGQLARTLSRLPGTMLYMPPEALEASSRYGPSLDVFSFGHLALFVGLQVDLPVYYRAIGSATFLVRLFFGGGGGGSRKVWKCHWLRLRKFHLSLSSKLNAIV
jgi:serine/threonine protein kinase